MKERKIATRIVSTISSKMGHDGTVERQQPHDIKWNHKNMCCRRLSTSAMTVKKLYTKTFVWPSQQRWYVQTIWSSSTTIFWTLFKEKEQEAQVILPKRSTTIGQQNWKRDLKVVYLRPLWSRPLRIEYSSEKRERRARGCKAVWTSSSCGGVIFHAQPPLHGLKSCI